MGRSEELGVGTLVVIENKKKKLYVKRATGLGASKTQWEKSYQPSQRKLILQKEERSGASLCAFSWSARGCLSVCGGSVRREEGVMLCQGPWVDCTFLLWVATPGRQCGISCYYQIVRHGLRPVTTTPKFYFGRGQCEA